MKKTTYAIIAIFAGFMLLELVFILILKSTGKPRDLSEYQTEQTHDYIHAGISPVNGDTIEVVVKTHNPGRVLDDETIESLSADSLFNFNGAYISRSRNDSAVIQVKVIRN